VNVKNGGVAYIFPDAAVRSARGMFTAKRASSGLDIDSVRARLKLRAAWCSPTSRPQPADPDGVHLGWREASRLCDRLAPKLISGWLRDGYIERVRRGVYRLTGGGK
jgi:hypothetical protein